MGWGVVIMRGWRVLVVAPLAAMLLTGSVLAQDDAQRDAGNSRRQVPAAECVVDPRPAEEIATLLELEGEGVPAPPTIQISAPIGAIVDVETANDIREGARQVIACFNAGDVPRAAALMTENGVRRAYWELSTTAENRERVRTQLAGAPQPRADETLVSLIAVTDVLFLSEELVAAFVVIDEPLLPPEGPETLMFIFANEDGMWRVDDWVDFTIVPVEVGAAATPEATPNP
jgi:hypothetical protein